MSDFSIMFFINSILLGVGLAMDAFSVSMANGLKEPKMKAGRMCLIAGVYAFFQFAMPMIGWICVHTIVVYFAAFEKFIPWIALILLLFIGGKMIFEGIKGGDEDDNEEKKLGIGILLVQGIATAIDALSVGFTIAEYNCAMALLASLIIAVVTFAICIAGLIIGKKVGTKLNNKASILGGVILIIIGIEIWAKGFLIPLIQKIQEVTSGI
ncbi:MAG: manganese efflux pump MntP family protein [Treponema sp.]|uniref:manganese efflux pump MntP n=1 Tax=Treponema sp. TaxID=166 RepID=UPI00298E02DC|nr:manganese efflux pump [Treponema sp.]MCQ2600124.1 manganese efflux pump MntP family protein [Treponema sp.]